MAEVPHYEMYIDGRWAEAAETFEVRSPAHGALIATVAQGDLASADAAVATAQAAHESVVWRTRTPLGLRDGMMSRPARTTTPS